MKSEVFGAEKSLELRCKMEGVGNPAGNGLGRFLAQANILCRVLYFIFKVKCCNTTYSSFNPLPAGTPDGRRKMSCSPDFLPLSQLQLRVLVI